MVSGRTSTQELKVNLTGDARSLTNATTQASKAMEDLSTDIAKVDAEAIDLQVNANTETTSNELGNLKKSVQQLDGEDIDIPAKLQMDRLNRDIANLNKVLDDIEHKKANPDVGLDLTGLIAGEKKARAALRGLQGERVALSATMNTSVSSTATSTSMNAVGMSMAESVISGFQGGLALSFGSALGSAVQQAFPTVRANIATAAQGAGELFATVMGRATHTAALGDAYRNVVVEVDNLNRALDGNEDSSAEAALAVDRHADAVGMAVDAYDRLVDKTGEVVSKTQYFAAAMGRARTNNQGWVSSILSARSSLAGVSGPVMDLEGDADDLGLSLGTAAVGLRGVGAAGGEAAGGLAAVGSAAPVAATGVGAVALALAAVAAVGWKFGRMAADVETSVTQLDALTVGKGAETFKELQAWAAKTPFAIDDATEATKKLVAAGVPLKQIPDWLNDIGNVASATGVPIAQVGTVFAQMVSKGKASYEELQQLAEAGVPVWGALGDKLNMPIAQVQKLATEGKLGADAIDLVRESLNEMYPTAMADQAGTFNGQLSTFQDTLSQTGQTLGTLFLPGMTQLLEFLNTMLGPIMATTQSIANLNSEMEQFTGGTGLIGLNPAKQLWGFFTGGADKSKESVKQLGTTSEEALAKVKAGLEGGAMSAEQLEQQARDIAEAFKGIGASVRAKVGFIIQKANLRSDILKAVGDGVKLPADLTIGQIGGLGDKKQKLIQDISAFAEEGLSEGARRAELNPNFDKAAWYAKVREGTRGLLIKAGIDKTEVDRVLANIMGLPRQMPPIGVTANTTQADASIAQTTAPKTVPITPTLPGLAASNGLLAGLASPRTAPVRPTLPGLGVASGMMSNLARPRNAPVTPVPRGLNVAAGFLNKLARPGGKGRTAPITPIATGAKPVQGALDKAAKPGGKARKAPVAAQVEKLSQLNSALKKATKPRNVTINVDDKGTASAKSAIDNAAKDRNTTIWVTTRKRGGGGGGGGGATAGTQSVAPSAQMMSLRTMAAAVAAPGADPWFSPTARVEARTAQAVARQAARVTSEPTQLAPRRTPVKIYLDGAEIADHLTLKTGRMAQVSLSGRKA